MNKIAQRMKEPSTWAGLAALAVLFGGDPAKANAVAQAAAMLLGAFAGTAAVVMPEKAAPTPAPAAEAGE